MGMVSSGVVVMGYVDGDVLGGLGLGLEILGGGVNGCGLLTVVQAVGGSGCSGLVEPASVMGSELVQAVGIGLGVVFVV